MHTILMTSSSFICDNIKSISFSVYNFKRKEKNFFYKFIINKSFIIDIYIIIQKYFLKY